VIIFPEGVFPNSRFFCKKVALHRVVLIGILIHDKWNCIWFFENHICIVTPGAIRLA